MITLHKIAEVSIVAAITIFALWALTLGAPLLVQIIVSPLLGFGFIKSISKGLTSDRKTTN